MNLDCMKNTMGNNILKIFVLLICCLFILPFSTEVKARGNSGIKDNGLGGIDIDIYSEPYTNNGWYAYGAPYGTGGCTWFVGSRVMELTGKGGYNTQVGETWYNSYGPGLGFATGQTLQAPAVICWSGHVAILEKIVGSTAYISEGGSTWYSDAAHDYTIIRAVNLSDVISLNTGFIGFVYLGVSDTTGPTVSNLHVREILFDQGQFTIKATVTDSSGIKKVQYYVWTENSGQDDLKCYDAVCTDNDNQYWARVKFSDHKGEKGKYKIHIYAYDNAGNPATQVELKYNFDSKGTEISNYYVGEFREGAFTILADVNNVNGIEYVKYAVWTKKNGQDDLKWYAGNCTDNNNNYWARINFVDHKNEKGTYIIHMYVKIKGGEEKSYGITYDFPEVGPTISDIKVSDVSSKGYTVTCKVTSAKDDVALGKIKFPTWTLKDEQDDLLKDWTTNSKANGTIKNGEVTFRVDTSDHNNETGAYRTHIYAYDVFGNSTNAAVPDVIVHDHNYNSEVIKATKTEQGYTLHTCSVCGDSYKDNYTDYQESKENTEDNTGDDSSETPSDKPSDVPTQDDSKSETTDIKLKAEVKDKKINFTWNVPNKDAAYGIVYALDEQELDIAEANNGYEVSGLKASGDTMTYECSAIVYENQPGGVWFRVVMKNGDELKHSNAVQITNWNDYNPNETKGGDPSDIPGEKSGDGQGDKQSNNPIDKPSGKDSGTDDSSQNSNNNDSNVTNSEKITLSALTVTKATPSTNQIAFTWSGDASATGYEIEYSVNADLSNPQKAYWSKHSLKYYRLTDLNENTNYYYRLRAYKGDGAEREYSEWTSVASVHTKANNNITTEAPTKQTYSAPKITLKSVKNNKKKTIVVKWKWHVKADGYQISYAKKKNFSGAKKKNVNAYKDSVTIKKLTKGKTYYVRIRAYVKDDNGNKVYGKWSGVKKVKIKK